MNLVKRGDVYHVRVMVNGERVWRSTGATTERKALLRAEEIKVELRQQRYGQKKTGPAPYVIDWIDTYLDTYSVKKAQGRALDANTLKAAREHFKHFRLDAVTPSMAVRFLTMRSAVRANATVNLERAVLGAVWQKAIDDGLVADNPWRKTEALPTKPRMRILTIENELALREVMIPRYQRWLTFMLGTGLRIGEARTITESDVDEKRELIYVPMEGAKGKKAREVPLRPEVLKVIREQLAAEDELWHAMASSYQEMLKLYAEKAGIPHLSPHDLRHTFATRFLQGGGDVFTLSKILGHESVTTTEKIYVHLKATDIVELSRHVDLGIAS